MCVCVCACVCVFVCLFVCLCLFVCVCVFGRGGVGRSGGEREGIEKKFGWNKSYLGNS